MNKLKVVVDTNVWVKGKIFPNSNPYHAKIMKWITNDEFILGFAQDTIGELFYIMKLRSLFTYKNNPNKGLKLLETILEYFYNGVSVNTSKTIAPNCNDPEDDMFIKCAIESEADYIIMDDRKRGMQDIKEVKALFPKEFVDLYHENLKQVAIDKEK